MGVSHGIQLTWRHLAKPNTASETGNCTQHPRIKYYSPLVMGGLGEFSFSYSWISYTSYFNRWGLFWL